MTLPPNGRSASHIYGVGRVIIGRAPQASVDSAPKGHRWRKLPRRDMRKPLAITIKYRGGAQGWVEVHARGDFHRYPGTTPIVEILKDASGY